MTVGAILLAVAYAGFVAALTVAIVWLRPKWSQRKIVIASSCLIPALLLGLGIFLAISTPFDTRPWTDFDKAEGYASAIWLGIFAAEALGVGLVTGWLVTTTLSAIRRRQ